MLITRAIETFTFSPPVKPYLAVLRPLIKCLFTTAIVRYWSSASLFCDAPVLPVQPSWKRFTPVDRVQMFALDFPTPPTIT